MVDPSSDKDSIRKAGLAHAHWKRFSNVTNRLQVLGELEELSIDSYCRSTVSGWNGTFVGNEGVMMYP